MTRKWIDEVDLSNGQYSVKKSIRFETLTLWSDLSNYSGSHIVVKETITLEDTNVNNWGDKRIVFKNNAPFRSCISKINKTFIGNTENLDIVMLMHNLLEYSDNYSLTSVVNM